MASRVRSCRPCVASGGRHRSNSRFGIEKKVSEDGIAQVSEMMPVLAADFVAYEDMKTYLIDEDTDLQETNQDLELIELIGVKNWLVQKLTGTAATV